jgi:acyl carrier protein
MNRDEVVTRIITGLNQLISDRGEASRSIVESTRILGGDLPVDSLDLAALVVQLEELTGCDPFSGGFIEFRTVGELASLYCPDGDHG